MKNEWIVIKLGGSILVPDGPDGEYLKAFRSIIRERVTHGEKFLITVGGGKLARVYQETLKSLGDIQQESEDWIGIHSIRLNAELVRHAFGDDAYEKIIERVGDFQETDKSIIICGAEEPGHSSNYDAVVFAEHRGARKIVNLSNINYVYDCDPRTNLEAKKYPTVSWEQYRTFIPQEWKPGLSTPFDPIASRKAQEADIDVVFMLGNPVTNLQKYLETGEAEGSIISNRFT